MRGVRAFSARMGVVVSVLLVLFTAVAGLAQTDEPAIPEPLDCEGTEAALDVTSEQMTFDNETHTFVFDDKVRVKRCHVVIQCDRLRVVRYADENRIKHVIATGNVRYRDGRRHAVAERADYYEDERKLVLVGNPRAWDVDRRNELSGEEIVVFLEEERILVSGARVRFHPDQSHGSEP